MGHILTSIVPERAKALTTHFDAVLSHLLTELGSRLWRNRQAACLATADLLQGRRWRQLQPHFGQLWEMALRVVDDIKDSVRENGKRLFRAVSGLTTRCCPPALLLSWTSRGARIVCLSLATLPGTACPPYCHLSTLFPSGQSVPNPTSLRLAFPFALASSIADCDLDQPPLLGCCP